MSDMTAMGDLYNNYMEAARELRELSKPKTKTTTLERIMDTLSSANKADGLRIVLAVSTLPFDSPTKSKIAAELYEAMANVIRMKIRHEDWIPND